MRCTMPRWICSLIALLASAGQAWALPWDADAQALMMPSNSPASFDLSNELPSDGTSGFEGISKSRSLLSALELPPLTTQKQTHLQMKPINCIVTSVAQGCWFDTALMQLVSPVDLANHFNPKQRNRRR